MVLFFYLQYTDESFHIHLLNVFSRQLSGCFECVFLLFFLCVCTSELFLAAISHTFLQILQLMFHLLVLSFCLLALPPVGTHIKKRHPERYLNTYINVYL